MPTHEKSKAERMAARYELVAELFKTSTGFMAPGKSVPPELCSEEYESGRITAWLKWTHEQKAEAAINLALYLQEEFEHYDQLYAALEQSDTNQLRQERDNLRLRIKAVDEEHEQIKAEREKMVQAYTALEKEYATYKRLTVNLETEREFYKKLWAIRGKALEQPCLGCGYTGNAIRLKNGEIP